MRLGFVTSISFILFNLFIVFLITFESLAFESLTPDDVSPRLTSPAAFRLLPSLLSPSSEPSFFKVSTDFYFNIWQGFLTHHDANRCTFEPTCSEYSRRAFGKYGIFKGVLMTTDRLIRCHPRNLEDANLNLTSDGREVEPLEGERRKAEGEKADKDHFLLSAFCLLPSAFSGNLEDEAILMATELMKASEKFNEDQSKSLQLARSLLNQGKYDLAAYEYERFLLFYPAIHRPEILYLLGLCRMLKGEWKASTEAFDLVINANGASDGLQRRALLKRAEAFASNSNLILARQMWREYIRRYPTTSEVGQLRLLLGTSYIQEGDWISAAEEFDRISIDFRETSLADLAGELSQDTKKWNKLPERSGFVAGSLSAIIPGMGYAYCNRYSDGVYAFLINAAFGAATFVSFKNRNTTSGIFFGWLLSSFYFGNIYGSVSAAAKFNENQRSAHLRQMLDKASEAYGQ
jgi:putative component of membrane protein insertase Oxa1/YidC/SpoIIIJ protein YidD/outer membrane protein assembly factor BamD (BamD/ComL family)